MASPFSSGTDADQGTHLQQGPPHLVFPQLAAAIAALPPPQPAPRLSADQRAAQEAARFAVQRDPALEARIAEVSARAADRLYTRESFLQNGMPAPLDPDDVRSARVYAQPRGYADEVELTRLPGQLISGHQLRSGDIPESYPVAYASRYMVHSVDVLSSADRGGPFDSRRSMKSDGREMGRTNRLADERWAANPNYRGFRAAAPDGQQLGAGEAATFRPLPSDPSQPYVYFVNRNDANFASDDRRFLSPEAFDQEFDGRRLAGRGGIKQQSAASEPPVLDRALGGRDPGTTMGIQAHELMGGAGRGGVAGISLASHEWCHLIGDGDGGHDHRDNLVVGTNAANTEQLAMETALRPYRRQLEAMDARVRLTVKVLTQDTPLIAPNGTGRGDKADFISYNVEVEDRDGHRTPVHRQIIDGQRGTITKLEYQALHDIVSASMERAVGRVQRDNATADARDARDAAAGRVGRSRHVDRSRATNSDRLGESGENRHRSRSRSRSRSRDSGDRGRSDRSLSPAAARAKKGNRGASSRR